MKKSLALCLLLFCSLSSFGRHALDSEVTLQGKIINAKTHKPVSANIEIFHNSDFISAYSMKESQQFTAPLKDFGMYLISISARGYVEATDTLWVVNEKRKSIDRNFYVVPVEVGLTVTLNNISFQRGKASLSSQSYAELDMMIPFFQENPGTTFEIAGHTDHSGPAEYNLFLSKARAQSVVDYLINHGVNSTQLIAQGYGDTRPLSKDRTPEAEAKNRRVEFIVLKVTANSDKKIN